MKHSTPLLGLSFLILAFSLSAPAAAQAASKARPHAQMLDAKGEVVGQATFTEDASGIEIHIELKHGLEGLKSKTLAAHIHENGKCEGPDFKSAGGHFNPTDHQHGFENPKGHHAGDIRMSVPVPAKGTLEATVQIKGVTLKSGEPDSLFKKEGTSLVLHDGVDDEKTDPAGNSGPRVFCGVIVQ